tara:strand:+ start:842 stop:1327 length:486 start_codon:yes stop_codon:yes gene_type:complete
MKITLVFENCEELTLNTDANTTFHLKNISTSEYLYSEEDRLIQETTFGKGHLIIPKNVVLDRQEGISSFINNGECSLDRILTYNDITHIIYNDKCIQPPWKGDYNDQENLSQKNYLTPKGNLVVDWNGDLLGEFKEHRERDYYGEVLVSDFLEYLDMNMFD